jgi:hypothetical protein
VSAFLLEVFPHLPQQFTPLKLVAQPVGVIGYLLVIIKQAGTKKEIALPAGQSGGNDSAFMLVDK